MTSQRYVSRWPWALTYWALPSMKSRCHGLDLMNWNKQTMLYDLYTKVWRFSMQYPLLNLLRLMGLVGIHDLDVLCCFNGITHCSWCGKEGQNKGTVVNHIWTVHYRLGLVCDRCHDCPSITSNTLHWHGQQDCCQPWGKNPNESASSK